ncbi:phage tail tape measure protein [Intestinibacillus massiliensis]
MGNDKTDYKLTIRLAGTVDPSLGAAANKASSTLGKGLQAAGKLALGAATATAAAAGAALAGIGSYAVKAGSDFEAGMSEVRAISGATSADMDVLSAKAKEMGETTKFSASESAEALKYMAMAGWKTQQMVDGLPGIMNLAAASGESLGSVSDIVTDALTAFGLQAADSAHFADVLAKAASSSNTNVGLMGATFKYVAPVAGALKYSVEDTAVAVGLMANAGIKGEQAGTALRSMLTNLAKPSDQVAQYMDAIGLSMTTANGQVKPLNTLLEEMRQKFSGLTDAEKAEYAAGIAGKEGMSGLLAIINTAPSDFNKLTQEIGNANGAAKEMADTMNDNLQGQVTLMQSNLEGVGIKIYDNLQGPLKDAVRVTNDSISEISASLSGGALEHSLSTISNGVGGLIASGAELAADVLPKLADGLAFVVDHGQQVGDILKTGAAGFVVFKAAAKMDAVTKGIKLASGAVVKYQAKQAAAAAAQKVFTGSLTASQTAVGILSGKIDFATAKQAIWNAVTAAHPFLIVGTAIAALVAGIGIYAAVTGDATSETKRFNDKQEELTKELEAQKKARDNLRESTAKSMKQSDAEIDAVSGYVKELDGYRDAQGRVNEKHKERADWLADEINRLIPGAVEKLEDEAGAHYKIRDSINEELVAKRKASMLEAMQPEIEENLGKRVETQNTLTDTMNERDNKQLQLSEKTKELDALKSGLDQFVSGSGYTGETHRVNGQVYSRESLTQAIQQVSQEKNTLEIQLEATKEKVKEAQKGVDELNESFQLQDMLTNATTPEEIDEISGKYYAHLKKYAEEEAGTLQETLRLTRDTYARRKKEIENSMSSMSESQRQRAQSELANLKADIDAAANAIGAGAAELLDVWETSLKDGQPDVAAAMKLIADGVLTAADVSSEMNRIGGSLVKGLTSGVLEERRKALGTVAGVAADIVNSTLAKVPKVSSKIPTIQAKKENGNTVPAMASGGIATGPTLALIGEGREHEAVLPLSKLDAMLARQSAAPAAGGQMGVTYAPVQQFYGTVNQEDVTRANAESFEQFKTWYQRMKDDERRAAFRRA